MMHYATGLSALFLVLMALSASTADSSEAKPTTPKPLADIASAMPHRGTASTRPAARWEDAFVSGNGHMGAMVYGQPDRETIVANHCRLFLPRGSREIVPDIAKFVPELRQIIRTKGYGPAMSFFLGKAKEQGFPGLIWTDPFHPGFEIKLQMPGGDLADYVRTEDFRTGEVAVKWTADTGAFVRRLFVSRTDNLIVLLIAGPKPGAVDCKLEMAPIRHKLIDSKIDADDQFIACHNVYVKGKGGYDGAVRIVPRGGTLTRAGSAIAIAGADQVLLLMRIEPYAKLDDSSVAKLKDSLAKVTGDYDALFKPHAAAHSALFDRVTLDLGGGADRNLTSEALLDRAQAEKKPSAALMEKMYDAGRYMFICAGGELPPNLQGIWTGTWSPAWSGDFTTDTNLQLAMSAVHSANMPELAEGYFRFIETYLPDWRENASKYYGCRGVMAPTRISNTGKMLHWGNWDGIWWTAGAGWMAHWFIDHYRYTGDKDFLARRTVPLLKEIALFYEDFLILDEKTGKYEFIPSYSPETGDGINATMDVMVAWDVLTGLIDACTVLGIEPDNVAKWKAMLARMPAYRIADDGALAEFIPSGYKEHPGHRHLSHLHAAYQATGELSLEKTPELWKAAQIAVRNRISANGEQSSHGRMHMGLTAAYLGLAEEAYGRLAIMATKRSMYSSLITAHEPGPAIFNVDANGAMPEIINRMLLFSWPGRLDLIPALPAAWPKGSISGMLARGQITIDRLAWDSAAGTLDLTFTSAIAQPVTLRMPPGVKVQRIIVEGNDQSLADQGAGRMGCVVQVPAGKKVNVGVRWVR